MPMGRPRKTRRDGTSAAPQLRIKIRVAGGAVGPGKIALLEHIERDGSISAAARCMGMSFRRAWHLIDSLNAALGRPVVETEVGGVRGGGARLSDFGRQLVVRYRAAAAAMDAEAAPLLDWLGDSGQE